MAKSMAGKPIKLFRCGNTRLDSLWMGPFREHSFTLKQTPFSPYIPAGSDASVVVYCFVHGPTVPCLLLCFLLLQLSIECSKVRAAEGKSLLCFSIIKINVPISMVPPTPANPSECTQWWPWKPPAVNGERSLLFFSAWKSMPWIYDIPVKICAKLCWL